MEASQNNQKETLYTVLKRQDLAPSEGGTSWAVVATAEEATSAAAALKRIAEYDGEAGEYVAVPERSWKPVKVTVEQQTVVKLG